MLRRIGPTKYRRLDKIEIVLNLIPFIIGSQISHLCGVSLFPGEFHVNTAGFYLHFFQIKTGRF